MVIASIYDFVRNLSLFSFVLLTTSVYQIKTIVLILEQYLICTHTVSKTVFPDQDSWATRDEYLSYECQWLWFFPFEISKKKKVWILLHWTLSFLIKSNEIDQKMTGLLNSYKIKNYFFHIHEHIIGTVFTNFFRVSKVKSLRVWGACSIWFRNSDVRMLVWKVMCSPWSLFLFVLWLNSESEPHLPQCPLFLQCFSWRNNT